MGGWLAGFRMINYPQSEFPLTHEKVEDCKEVFMLFDRDCDGVLSFTECVTALHTMGYRISGPPPPPPPLSV